MRRIEVEPKSVYWSESGELVALCCEDTFYVLRFDREAYNQAVAAGQVDEDGVEAAFEMVTDQSEVVRTGMLPETIILQVRQLLIHASGCFVGDVFIFSSSSNR